MRLARSRTHAPAPGPAATPAPAARGQRVGRVSLIAGAVSAAVLVAYLFAWLAVSPVRQRGSDFSVDYVAALLIREGHAAQLYDQAAEAHRHAQLLPSGVTFDLPFIGPPTAALLTVPLTLTDPQTAYRLWSAMQLLLAAAAVAIACRAAPWGGGANRAARVATCAAALAAPATLVLLLMGQWDGALALALATALTALQRQRPAAAGLVVALAFAATKPHLALGLAAFLLARREWRALGGAAAGVLVAAAASLAVVGTAGLVAFAGALGGAFSNTPAQSTTGLAGLVSSWLGTGRLTAALVVTGSVLALGACTVLGDRSRRPGMLAPTLGGATALSLLLAPHLLVHDLTILAPAMVWCTGWYVRRTGATIARPLAVWLGVCCLMGLDAGNGAAAPPGRLVPWMLMAGGIAALRVTASERPATDGDAARLAVSSRQAS